MPLDPEQQRARYLAKRVCGNCGRQAIAMRPWGEGRRIPICTPCGDRLDGVLRESDEERWEREYEHEPDYGPDEEE